MTLTVALAACATGPVSPYYASVPVAGGPPDGYRMVEPDGSPVRRAVKSGPARQAKSQPARPRDEAAPDEITSATKAGRTSSGGVDSADKPFGTEKPDWEKNLDRQIRSICRGC